MKNKALFFSVVGLVFLFVSTPTFGQCGVSDRLFGRCYADGGGYVSGYAGGYRQGGPGTVRQPSRWTQSIRIAGGWGAVFADGADTGADIWLGSKQISSDERALLAQEETKRLALEYEHGQRPVFHGQSAGYGGGGGGYGGSGDQPQPYFEGTPRQPFSLTNGSSVYIDVYAGNGQSEAFMFRMSPGERREVGPPPSGGYYRGEGLVPFNPPPGPGAKAEIRKGDLLVKGTGTGWVFCSPVGGCPQ